MTIFQPPNVPLYIWMISKIVSIFTHGLVHGISVTISIVAIIAWSYLELTQGVNWFRKLLGGTVLIVSTISLFNSLR